MDTCAQPYGVNTPGAIAKTFGVLAPALALASAEGLDTEAAMKRAWSVACAANFVGDLVKTVSPGHLLGAFSCDVFLEPVQAASSSSPAPSWPCSCSSACPLEAKHTDPRTPKLCGTRDIL